MTYENLEELYNDVIQIWQSFCELHTKLYDLTCDEYMMLLSSDIDNLLPVIDDKEKIITLIEELEQTRQLVIQNINTGLSPEGKIKNVSELISFMKTFEERNNHNYLQRLNGLLIDIIEKIQKQSKQNQVFLNKAMISLNEMKQDLSGEKSYNSYNARGKSQSISTQR